MTTTEPTTAEQVIAAARDLARRYQIGDYRRLTPEARRLVEAVLEHDRETPQ